MKRPPPKKPPRTKPAITAGEKEEKFQIPDKSGHCGTSAQHPLSPSATSRNIPALSPPSPAAKMGWNHAPKQASSPPYRICRLVVKYPKSVQLKLQDFVRADSQELLMAKVLVVDDHRDMREVVAHLLSLHGHSIDMAESGEDAWEQLQTSPPDAVVIDHRLPGMSGMQLLLRIRQNEKLAHLAVVLCSGDDTERDAAQSAGAYGFWLKGSDKMFEGLEQLGQNLNHK
jgi:CheY-like chemotaxis protein